MKLARFATLAALFAAGASSIVFAQAMPPEKAFGARQGVISADLSPDGHMLAFIAPTQKQGNALFTVPVDGNATPRKVVAASGDPERLHRCDWIGNTRLLCVVYTVRDEAGYAVGITRLVAVDADGSNIKVVSQRDRDEAWYFNAYGGDVIDWLPGQDGVVLMMRWHVPESKAGSLIRKTDEGLGVDRIDTRTLAAKRAVAPMDKADYFITDGTGNVRIAAIAKTTAQYIRTGTLHYLYRPKNSSEWKDLSDYTDLTREGFRPIAVDPVEDAVYGLEKRNGRFALYKRRLDGTSATTLVYARDDVDVDGVAVLGRKRRIIGARFATDRRQVIYFDPALHKLSVALSKAIPGSPLIRIEGASDDEQRLLIWAGSDIDPGRYYLMDRGAKQLRPLILTRPELADVKLAPVKPVNIKASDGALIPAFLTLPPDTSGKGLPAIVMPHGGPGARDYWGFDWLAQYFAHRGYAVLQPNFRGSTGYGDEWFRENGFRSWRSAIGDVTDSGRWLVSEGIADSAKLAIFGWSYGGYAALQSGVAAPDLFKAIVAVAPVTDLDSLKKEYLRTSAQREIRDFIGTGPHVREGSPAQNAGTIKAPVMIFHGDVDLNVDVQESRLMADKLRAAGKSVQLTIYPKLDHYLEDADTRADMLGKSDAFLRATLGIK